MAALSSDDINKVLDDVCSSSSSSSSTCEKESLNAILEVQYIKDHYDEMEFIDEGGCGAVYKARHRIDMKWYALKFIDIGKEPGKDILLREAKISSSITNENVIKYHTSHLFNLFAEQGLNSKVDTDDDDSSIMFSNSPNSDKKSNTSSKSDDQEQEVLVIQMELCNCNKNLKKVIKDTNSQLFSNQNYRQNIIKGIINGLRCIHDEGIMHRDLKPANIFFDDKDTVKIGDFGFAQHYILKSTAENSDDLPSQGETKHKDFTNKLGTWPYKAPEVDDKKRRYDKRVDIYSLGIILFELYYPMYSGSERATVLTNLRKPTVEFPEDFEHKVGVPHIKQVLQCLLDHDPCKRYPIEILEEILIKTDSKMMVTADIVQQEQGDAPPVMYRQTSKHPSFRRQQNEPSPVCFSVANIVRQQHQQPEICSDDVHQQQPVSTSSEASNIEEQASNATQKMDEELVDHVKNGIANFHLHSGKDMRINDNDDA